jgi:hypothetical protein
MVVVLATVEAAVRSSILDAPRIDCKQARSESSARRALGAVLERRAPGQSHPFATNPRALPDEVGVRSKRRFRRARHRDELRDGLRLAVARRHARRLPERGAGNLACDDQLNQGALAEAAVVTHLQSPPPACTEDQHCLSMDCHDGACDGDSGDDCQTWNHVYPSCYAPFVCIDHECDVR